MTTSGGPDSGAPTRKRMAERKFTDQEVIDHIAEDIVNEIDDSYLIRDIAEEENLTREKAAERLKETNAEWIEVRRRDIAYEEAARRFAKMPPHWLEVELRNMEEEKRESDEQFRKEERENFENKELDYDSDEATLDDVVNWLKRIVKEEMRTQNKIDQLHWKTAAEVEGRLGPILKHIEDGIVEHLDELFTPKIIDMHDLAGTLAGAKRIDDHHIEVPHESIEKLDKNMELTGGKKTDILVYEIPPRIHDGFKGAMKAALKELAEESTGGT